MVERMDIDALLIGALYSELSPADEALLSAHLESHPGDRAVLDDLKSARSAIRASRILEVQLEPPQAVSAMLLQEAARRAPRRVRSEDENVSWFHRFTSSFMRHPAMAAAAMLVLVVGVASTLYVRNGDQFAENTVASTPTPAVVAQRQDDQDLARASDRARAAEEATQNKPTPPAVEGIATGSAAGYDAAKNEIAKTIAPAKVGLSKGTANPVAKPKAAAHAGGKQSKQDSYIEVGASDLAPKDIGPDPYSYKKSPSPKSADVSKEPSRGSLADGEMQGERKTGTATTVAQGPVNSVSSSNAGGAGAAPGAVYGSAKPQPSPTKPQAPRTTTTAPTVQPAPPPPPPQQIAVDKAPVADSKKSDKPDDSLLAWAKAEHAHAISIARSGKCNEAAKIAVIVQNRAPDYYTQYMSTDRALKPCQQYINDARDKDAEQTAKSRAQKRVNSEAPAASSK